MLRHDTTRHDAEQRARTIDRCSGPERPYPPPPPPIVRLRSSIATDACTHTFGARGGAQRRACVPAVVGLAGSAVLLYSALFWSLSHPSPVLDTRRPTSPTSPLVHDSSSTCSSARPARSVSVLGPAPASIPAPARALLLFNAAADDAAADEGEACVIIAPGKR